MSLSNIYQSFLATPNPDALANDATLNYITTLTTFTDSGPIVKHLTSQQRALKKNKEKVLCAIENSYAVYLEIETTLEFVTGGGAYLPNLDDNFLTDRVVIFPIVRLCSRSWLGLRSNCSDSFIPFTLTRPRRSNRSAFIGTRALYSSP